ncbi:hypothetical protein ACJYGZ_006656 [Pseudomonas aeruginosa]|uniref:hypothetical protein n=1 Tax=Pseudomonas TaxID=286 RepID=UPI001A23620D|nr:hypothetical protein [Pseudomonas sp. zfem003]EKU4839423.1 hypothetical protein [Pseudomonas aeruginosa]EKW6686264.1 hypothetical protein [Pseudomonas aeruginosa]EKX6190053.1 hypothetical protein [Pseudomonas aeruginosa]MBH8998457.1 hypothetical protein [Pseudomonas aeruginosa]MDO5963423.1 hypothetical protein [Pseudomonas aeruginosa]
MRLAFLKELFDGGLLVGATVEPAEGDGWLLKVTKQSGEVVAVTLAAQTSQVKVYNRVNAAMMDAWRIGFRSVAVTLPDDFELTGAR